MFKRPYIVGYLCSRPISRWRLLPVNGPPKVKQGNNYPKENKTDDPAGSNGTDRANAAINPILP
jgi:hypothetical protein